MLAVLKKELKTYLLTPLGYVFIGIFMIIFSLFFCMEIFLVSEQGGQISFEYLFYNVSTILTFFIPVLTMRMFSEERKTGTEQLLLTSPRSIASIVLGKLLSGIFIIVITALLTMIYFFILNHFGKQSLEIALTTLLGYMLLSFAYISVGMFVSSITESQILAYILAEVIFMFNWFAPSIISSLEPFCLIQMFYNFVSGVVSVSEIITILSFSLVFILLTMLVLQKRKSVNR